MEIAFLFPTLEKIGKKKNAHATRMLTLSTFLFFYWSRMTFLVPKSKFDDNDTTYGSLLIIIIGYGKCMFIRANCNFLQKKASSLGQPIHFLR